MDKNIQNESFLVSKKDRSLLLKQKPCVLWFTGLSGSGKSTLAKELEKRLFELNHLTFSLDGDNIRSGLNSDLKFTDNDREENIRRIAHVSKLFVDAGLIVTCSFISPFKQERELARNLIEFGSFIEIFVNAPLNICEKRDVKGLYGKARKGLITNFTGIDSEYENPINSEIEIRTDLITIEDSVNLIINYLEKKGFLKND